MSSLLQIMQAVSRACETVDEDVRLRIETGGDLLRLEMCLEQGPMTMRLERLLHRSEIEGDRGGVIALTVIEDMGKILRRRLEERP